MNLVVTVSLKSNHITDCLMIIFGGTGDLTHRKLLPAIYNLIKQNQLPEHFGLVSIGRREKTDEAYRQDLYEAIKAYSRFDLDEQLWDELKEKIYYYQMDFTNQKDFLKLNEYLLNVEHILQTPGNRIYYLAVAPEFFETIVLNLDTCCVHNQKSWQRVVIEKPFGRDLESAKNLNNHIVGVFREENTFRIDHYLGKEMLQNIMVIRFANILFEPLWNYNFIEQVQISANETLGVETRGGYYEQSGAIRDMVQSHLLQLMSLIAMEKPKDQSPNAIRDEKVKVLKHLKPLSQKEVKENVVRGQYGPSDTQIAYRSEDRVDPKSTTETYVAFKCEVDNERWKGVPFYIRTGKRMPKKSTEIVIQFKKVNNFLYHNQQLMPNQLVIHVQPMEGVYFQFNAKKPGEKNTIIPVEMDFCQNCQVGINSPEAYERLLYDVILGDATLFARWDEVLYSWTYIDSILEAWQKEQPNFPNYESGTYGPKEAEQLLLKDQKEWINI